MGFFDSFSDLVSAATPWSQVEAEAAPAPEKEDEQSEESESTDKKEENDEEESKDDNEKEDEPEEEEEMIDPKEKFEDECKESKECHGPKHHFDECVERVTNATQSENKKAPHEDCVEEFFHLAHCANACAAPKVWAALK